ncbi:hypothetical protein N8751_00235 [bacterium]|nr:hypothetical protein [bacterium]
MLKNLIYALLLHKSFGEKVNIANCDELWGMTNSMNRQTMYSMKIYSCVVNPSIVYNIDQLLPNITDITSMVNTSNISNVSNIINETHITNTTSMVNTSNISNVSNIINETHITNITSMINTSNLYNVTLNNTNQNYEFIMNSSNTSTPSSSKVNIDSLYRDSPSPKKNNEIDNINQDEVSNVDYSSPSSSVKQDKSDIVNNELDVGLIIGIVVSSCFAAMTTIFAIIWYKNKKMTNNISPVKSLKSRTPVAKPHVLNTSQVSSKTDETVVGSPHPPLPENDPDLKHKNLPNLPPPEVNNTDEEEAGNESKDIIDLESGNKEPIKIE